MPLAWADLEVMPHSILSEFAAGYAAVTASLIEFVLDCRINRLNKEYQYREEKAIYARLVSPLGKNARRILRHTEEWRSIARAVSAFRTEMQLTFPEFYDLLIACVKQEDGQLYRFKTIEVETQDRIGRSHRHREKIRESLGRVRGGQFLVADPQSLLDRGRSVLSKVVNLLDQNPTTNDEFRQILDLRNESRTMLVDTANICTGAVAFCDPSNLKDIIRWARLNSDIPGKFRLQARKIIALVPDWVGKQKCEVTIPADLRRIDQHLVRSLLR